jgi:TolA-binding protein
MSETVIVAIISLTGTLFGTLGGIVASGKLTGYRIDRLEEQVKKHNSVIERMYKLEERTAVVEEQVKMANNRIDDLEHQKQGT